MGSQRGGYPLQGLLSLREAEAHERAATLEAAREALGEARKARARASEALQGWEREVDLFREQARSWRVLGCELGSLQEEAAQEDALLRELAGARRRAQEAQTWEEAAQRAELEAHAAWEEASRGVEAARRHKEAWEEGRRRSALAREEDELEERSVHAWATGRGERG